MINGKKYLFSIRKLSGAPTPDSETRNELVVSQPQANLQEMSNEIMEPGNATLTTGVSRLRLEGSVSNPGFIKANVRWRANTPIPKQNRRESKKKDKPKGDIFRIRKEKPSSRSKKATFATRAERKLIEEYLLQVDGGNFLASFVKDQNILRT